MTPNKLKKLKCIWLWWRTSYDALRNSVFSSLTFLFRSADSANKEELELLREDFQNNLEHTKQNYDRTVKKLQQTNEKLQRDKEMLQSELEALRNEFEMALKSIVNSVSYISHLLH